VTGHTPQAHTQFPATAVVPPPSHAPSAESVQEQLSRLVSSKCFARSKDLCRFLRFVVEQTLRNRAVRLKEYLIGFTVFERGENFNPGTDPIVRVQARRLRSKLSQYYETEGWKDTVRIDLPSGRYVPVFRYRRLPAASRSLVLESPPVTSRSADEVSTIQEEVSQAVADVLRAHLSKRPEPGQNQASAAPADAQHFCSKGQICLDQPTPEAIRLAMESFELPISVDPGHASAHAGLAGVYATAGVTGVYPLNAAMARVKSLATKALELDGRLAEAHAARALALAAHDWDFPGAEKEFRQALDLGPGLAQAHHWYALGSLLPFGRVERAILELKVALEFAPLSANIQSDLAWALCLGRRYEEALELCRRALDAAPGFFRAHWVLGLTYESQNKLDAALASYEQASRLSGVEPLPEVAASQGYAYALAGKRDEAARRLEALADGALSGGIALAVATVYLGLGDTDRTFEWLEKAVHEREGGLIWLNVNPRFAHLRADVRFDKIVTRLGLIPSPEAAG
jgi:tetratricopeptide (TPR) repeat protein